MSLPSFERVQLAAKQIEKTRFLQYHDESMELHGGSLKTYS